MIRDVGNLDTIKTLISQVTKNIAQLSQGPVTIEVLDKLDLTKYLIKLGDKITEAISQKDLVLKAKYWAEVKTEENGLVKLLNLAKKPDALQNLSADDDLLANTLDFEKLKKVVNDYVNQSAKPKPTTEMPSDTNAKEAKADDLQKEQKNQDIKSAKEEIKKEIVEDKKQDVQSTAQKEAKDTQKEPAAQSSQKDSQSQSAKTENRDAINEVPKKVLESEVSIKDEKLVKKEQDIEKNDKNSEKNTQKTQNQDKLESAKEEIKKEIVEDKKQNVQSTAQKEGSKEVQKELTAQEKTKEATKEKAQVQEHKSESKNNSEIKNDTSKESPKEVQNQNLKTENKQTTGEVQKNQPKEQGSQAQKTNEQALSQSKLEALKEKQKDISDIAQQMVHKDGEKKDGALATQSQKEEKKLAETLLEAIKTEVMSGGITKDEIKMLMSEDTTINDGEKVSNKNDDTIEAREPKERDKMTLPDKREQDEEKVEAEAIKREKTDENTIKEWKKEISADTPSSKIKTEVLNEMSKSESKEQFQVFSNIALNINKNGFTFFIKGENGEKDILQFRKKSNRGYGAPKSVEFYSAFEKLGPVAGEIWQHDNQTYLSLKVEFESTMKALEKNLSELEFFDKKNVSLKKGITELFQLQSSLLNLVG